MRTLLIGVIVGALLVLLALPLGGGEVSADNGPHIQGAGVTTDSCAGCHRAHTAQAEGILKQAQPGLCYSCHGTGGPGADTAVQEGKLYGNPSGAPYGGKTTFTALKGGGFEYALIDTDDPTSNTIGALTTPALTKSWHTEDGTSGTMWGNSAISATPDPGKTNYALRCGSCHDPHGNSLYRILRSVPKGSGGGGQSISDETPKVYDTTDYFDVTYLTGTDIANWCTQCHTRYLASSGSADADSGDAIFTYRHASDGNGVPTCIKCHAAHGTNAATDSGGYSEGVEWPGGGSGTTDTNNSRLLKMDNRGICQKCHNK